jgi:hypothetical protein
MDLDLLVYKNEIFYSNNTMDKLSIIDKDPSLEKIYENRTLKKIYENPASKKFIIFQKSILKLKNHAMK